MAKGALGCESDLGGTEIRAEGEQSAAVTIDHSRSMRPYSGQNPSPLIYNIDPHQDGDDQTRH